MKFAYSLIKIVLPPLSLCSCPQINYSIIAACCWLLLLDFCLLNFFRSGEVICLGQYIRSKKCGPCNIPVTSVFQVGSVGGIFSYSIYSNLYQFCSQCDIIMIETFASPPLKWYMVPVRAKIDQGSIMAWTDLYNLGSQMTYIIKSQLTKMYQEPHFWL